MKSRSTFILVVGLLAIVLVSVIVGLKMYMRNIEYRDNLADARDFYELATPGMTEDDTEEILGISWGATFGPLIDGTGKLRRPIMATSKVFGDTERNSCVQVGVFFNADHVLVRVAISRGYQGDASEVKEKHIIESKGLSVKEWSSSDKL